MKKTTLLVTMLLSFALLSFGQLSTNIDVLKTTHEISMDAKKAIPLNAKGDPEVEISCLGKYAPGETMDLYFTLSYSASYHFGDYFEITFPEGITPTGGSDPITYNVYGSPNEALNDIDGQTISWGDDDNYFGGIDYGTHTFFVTIEVSEDFTGDAELTYKFSTDTYFNVFTAFELEGTVTVASIPATPDLKIKRIGYIAEYKSIPVDQATFTPEAIVFNEGASLTEATNANLTIGEYSDEVAINVPLKPFKNDSVVFSEYTAQDTGLFDLIFTANATDDFNSNNKSDTAKLNIHPTDLIRDNGNFIGSQSISGTKEGIIGNVFTILAKDTLNSIVVYLGDIDSGTELSACIYSMGENGPESELGKSMTFTVDKQNKFYTTFFKEEVVLEPGKYFIGINEPIARSYVGFTDDPYIDGTCWGYWSDSWKDLGALGFGRTFMLRPQFGTERPIFEVSMTELNVNAYHKIGDEVSLDAVIENFSLDTVTEIEVFFTVNGGSQVSHTVTEDILPLSTYEFEISDAINSTEEGNYEIKMFISEPNGILDESQENDTIMANTYAMETTPTKRVFGEEGTGTWCGWCPRGAVFMDYMAETYPETWVGVAVHAGDRMQLFPYTSYINQSISGYPGALVDRNTESMDPFYFEQAYQKSIKNTSPVDISIKNISYDAATRELKFDVNGEFLAPAKGYRFSAIIVENGVTGLDSKYAQNNYYSGGASGTMGGYESLDNPVPAEDMVYNHVARQLLGGWIGTENSLPAEITKGETHSYSYTTTLANDWNPGEIDIIAIMVNEETAEVSNSIMADANLDAQTKITFKTTHEENALDSVNIVINTDTILSNDEGYAYLFLDNNTYTYNAFNDELVNNGSFTLESDDMFMELIMDYPMYTATFNITSEDVAVEGVSIAINEETFTTDENGSVSLNLYNGEYVYTLSKEGYISVTDTLIINNENTTENVTMLINSILDSYNLKQNIYPNPFNNRLIINNLEENYQITLCNSVGQVVKKLTNTSSSIQISTDDLDKGVYIISVSNKTTKCKAIVVKQ